MGGGTQTGSGSGGSSGSSATDPTLVSAQDLVPTEPPATRVTDPADEALAPGTMVGEYHILRRLPKGAMGAVYAAVHPVIGKQAAVKVIARRLSGDSSAVARFVQEARSVNQIGHVNIVDVFAFGELSDGRPYYVMEWLHGESLAERVQRGPLDLHEALEVLDPVADALEAAHEKGVVHRDLKPDNVFLVEVRHNRRLVKLLDFGIAKLHALHEAAPEPTQTGMVMGTPGYISPEQARGKSVDHRTDVYALGCMAYQMMTGRLPFPAESAMDMIALHLTQPPPRASTQRRGLPDAFDDLILQMMSKRAEDRPSLASIRTRIGDLLANIGDTGKASTGDPRRSPYRPRLETPSIGVVVSTPGADPQGPEALMATAAPGELASAAAGAADASGGMRVMRTSGQAVPPGRPSARADAIADAAPLASASSGPSLPATRPASRRPRLLLAGVLGGVALAVAVLLGRGGEGDDGGAAGAGQQMPPMPMASERPAVAGPGAPAAPRPGALIVQVDPKEARVALDGKPLVVVDGFVRVELEPGTPHLVLVEARGHQSMQFDVEVSEGETVKVPVRLPRGSGRGRLTAPAPPAVPAASEAPAQPDAAAPAPAPAPADAQKPKPKGDKNYTIDPF